MPLPGYIDATRISPKLYVGSRPRTGRLLREIGFDVLVLCAQPSEYKLTYGVSGREFYAHFPGLQVIGCPLDDSEERPDYESIKNAFLVAREVAHSIRRGRRVLLTCMEGRNRSAFVAALALHDLSGRSGPDCEEKVRAERGAQLGPSKPVLFNTHFRMILATIKERAPAHPRRRIVPPGASRSMDARGEGDSDPGLGGGAP
jgi:hypothetical protein